jgi:hypothetical protein
MMWAVSAYLDDSNSVEFPLSLFIFIVSVCVIIFDVLCLVRIKNSNIQVPKSKY